MADSDQNGRRITQNMHPNDPRLKHNTTNYESSVTNSRDFVRINGDNYHYRHDWDHKDNSKTGLNNFCHNQTQSASIFSQALAERNSAYTVPNPAGRPLNGNVNQCNQSAPLPPQQVNLAAPLPHSRNMNVPPPPMMTMPQVLLPPPPPPPPPLPAPAPVTSPSNDKPVLPPMFDASRPPPPLPAYIRENGKHKMSTSVEAGPSKIRKPEQSKACSGLCEKCVQRQIRIDIYKQEMEQLLAEDEKRSLAYKKKLQALEKSKQLIKSCYSEELFHFFEEYVEEIPDLFQGDDFLSQFSSTSSMVSSKFSGQILLQLMKLMARNINDSPASLEEALLPALRGAAGARRASPAEPAAAGELLAELAAALAAANPAPPAAPAPTAPAALRPPTFPPPALPPPTYAAPPPGFPPPPHYFPYPQ